MAGLRPATALLVLTLLGCRPEPSLPALYAQADALRIKGDYRGAIAQVDGVLAQNPHDPQQFWKFYLLKAELTQNVSGGTPALNLLAKEIPPQAGNEALRLRRKIAQANAHYSISRYPAALKELGEAYELAKTLKDEYHLSSICTFRAQILIDSQHPGQADAYLKEGYRYALASGSRTREAYNLQIVAQLAMLRSRFEDCINALDQELNILKPNKTSRLSIGALIDLGTCHLRLGRSDQALELTDKAEQLAKAYGDLRDRQVALANIGLIHMERHEYEEARKFLKEALEGATQHGSESSRAKYMSNLAQIAIETKNWAEAAAYNIQALQLKRDLQITTAELYSLVNSALILEGEGQPDEAEKVFIDVVRRQTDDPNPQIDAHSGLAHLYASTGKDAQADKSFEAALNVVEKSRSVLKKDQSKIDFLTRMIVIYDNYVDFLMSRGRTERALELAETSRARILQERLRGRSQATPAVKASAYRRLAQSAGATLVSYFLGENRSYVWLITPTQIIAYTLAPEATLRKTVENYRALIESMRDPLQVEDSNGRDLYDALLQPISDHLPKGSNLIIVPDGALNALNFETIPVASPTPHYLIEDATISVVPSLNLVIQSRFQDQLSGKLLLIGDPEQVDSRYPSLPYAEKEISAVESHFPASSVVSYRRNAAEPSAYLQSTVSGFSFVHFTAHATWDAAVPLNSAIVLSGKPNTYELTAMDVLNKPAHAGLVTISACRSAGAKTYAGEGLVGFMWAFFNAGAHGVIAGLWDVNDESTPHLMDQLYAGLTQGQSPSQALRNAKLELRKFNEDYRLPFYWGPFQLYLRDTAMLRKHQPGVM